MRRIGIGTDDTILRVERARRSRRSIIAVLALALLVSAGAPSQATAVTTAGQVYAFGYNHYGQLGNAIGSATDEPGPTPALVTLPGAGGPVTQIAAGGEHSLAVTSTGQLYACGENRYGQLGNTINDKTEEPNPTPTPVTLPDAGGPVTQVAAGGGHSLAVTSTGQLYAFGDNRYGQLGNAINDKTNEPNPTPTLVTLPDAGGPVTQVAAGDDHSLAVTSTGQLYAFGDNDSGQLGNATNDNTNEPNPTPTLVTLPGAGGPVTEVAAGAGHSLAVTSTGQLYAFGYNRYGQLGNAIDSGTDEPEPTPVLVTLPGAGGPVTQVAAGGDHSLAVTSTGQLYAFGVNDSGQLGNAINDNTSEPNPTPTLVTLPGAGGPVTQIAAGDAHSLAVTSTGQLYAFGENFFGQLGSTINVEASEPNPTPTLVTLAAGTTIDTIARGPGAVHSLALIADLGVSNGSLAAGQVGVPYSTAALAVGGTAPYSWSASGLPSGLSINPASGQIAGTPTIPGAVNVTLTVTDAFGIIANSAVIPLTIAPPATKPSPPAISSAALTNRRFRITKRSTAISARKTPLGTVVRFTLSAPAKLQIKITHSAPGLRRGHSCLAPSAKLRREHAKHCTRTLTSGTLTRARELQGADRLAFSGRIGHHALARGAYKALLSASDEAGRSKTVPLSFTIVR